METDPNTSEEWETFFLNISIVAIIERERSEPTLCWRVKTLMSVFINHYRGDIKHKIISAVRLPIKCWKNSATP